MKTRVLDDHQVCAAAVSQFPQYWTDIFHYSGPDIPVPTNDHFNKLFKGLDKVDDDVIFTKGHWCYVNLDSFDRLQETELSLKHNFYSTLTEYEIIWSSK